MRCSCLLFLVAFLTGLSGCGSSEDEDLCLGKICRDPPENSCKDMTTLMVYRTQGECDSRTGECAYAYYEQHCEYGCFVDHCLAEDKCRGIVCDQPPGNECNDENTMLVYESTGTCDLDTGECEYSSSERHCENGCEDGVCKDQDLCQDVICNDPPDKVCKDETTLREYAQEGTCDPATGRCNYEHTETYCELGCEASHCVLEKEAWGWVHVMELNDAYPNGPFIRPARAFFASEPRWIWAPEHQQLALTCRMILKEGPCAVYEGEGTDPSEMFCDPECGYDEECILEDEEYICRPLPYTYNVGTITIQGLKIEASLELPSDRSYYYDFSWPDDDLFDSGDPVIASASGGELGPFSLEATGVASLELESSVIELIRGRPAVISWTAADPGSRVQVLLSGGSHYPHIYFTTILCDLADDAGRVEIPEAIVNIFYDQVSGIRRSSRVTRYTRSTILPFGQSIEITVGSVRNLQIDCDCSPY